MTITRLWSEQFGDGMTANFLPGGAGTRGQSSSYVLMAARGDGLLHAGASIDIGAGTSSENIKVRLARLDDGGYPVPVGTGVVGGGTASLLAPSDPAVLGGAVADLVVVAFQDSNNNGHIDAGELLAQSTPARFRVVTRERYDQALQQLQAMATAGRASGYPFAGSLLGSFVGGQPPEQCTVSRSSVSATELSHAVGVRFLSSGPGAEGTIPQYTFDRDSRISRAVVVSPEYQKLLADLVGGTCLDPAAAPKAITGSIRFHESTDLFFAFATAAFSAQLSVSGELARVKGTVSDLYDFDYDGNAQQGFAAELFDPNGASLQAGFGTLGPNGVIFRSVVEVDDTVSLPVCSDCRFVLSTTSVSAGSAGGDFSVGVTAGAGCHEWTVVSNVPFITVTGRSRVSGSGSATFSVASNTGGPRTGTLVVAGQTVTVTQQAGTASATCVSIAGAWNVSETASVSCTNGDRFGPDTEQGRVTIAQSGCSATWNGGFPDQPVLNTAVIADRFLTVSSLAIAPPAGAVLTVNTFSGTGTVSVDGRRLDLSGTGTWAGTYQGASNSCTVTRAATLVR